AAIRKLQKDAGITVDGRVGKQTLTALATYQKPKPAPLPEPAPEPEEDLSGFYVAGATRYDTNAAVALKRFPEGADVVYLAEGRAYSDQNAAAGFGDGPVLLVGKTLPLATADAIRALGPKEIVPVGDVVPVDVFREARDIAGL